jgi:hypothetical protein
MIEEPTGFEYIRALAAAAIIWNGWLLLMSGGYGVFEHLAYWFGQNNVLHEATLALLDFVAYFLVIAIGAVWLFSGAQSDVWRGGMLGAVSGGLMLIVALLTDRVENILGISFYSPRPGFLDFIFLIGTCALIGYFYNKSEDVATAAYLG